MSEIKNQLKEIFCGCRIVNNSKSCFSVFIKTELDRQEILDKTKCFNAKNITIFNSELKNRYMLLMEV